MKKIIALCMALVLSATVLCACSNDEENDTENKENTTSTESLTEEKTTSTEAQNSINIEDVDLFDFSFELDGVVYTLPCDFSEFEKNGWSISEYSKESIEEDPELPANEWSVFFDLVKDNSSDDSYNKVSVSFINSTSDYKEIMKCQVGGFRVDMDVVTEGLEMGPAVKFPGGISIDRDVKYDDIVAKYGEPDEFSEGRYDKTMKYYEQENDYRKRFYANIYSKDQSWYSIDSIFQLHYEYSPETALENSTEAEEGTENTTQTATEGLTATEPTTNENAT